LEYYFPVFSNEPPNIISAENPAYKRRVRILFRKTGEEWKAFYHDVSDPETLSASLKYYPDTVTWFAYYEGHVLATFCSYRPDAIRWYRDIGIHIPCSNAKLPVIGKLSREFSGWVNAPCLRPLVLASEDKAKNPDGWKQWDDVDSEIIKLCIPQFRKILPNADTSHEYEKIELINYQDINIVLNKAYKSNKNEYLIACMLNPKLQHAEKVPKEELSSIWFYIDSERHVKPLGDGIKPVDDYGMRLVDIGDFDNGGTAEVIFWKSGYNKGGYVMYYDHFTRSVDFQWGYH